MGGVSIAESQRTYLVVSAVENQPLLKAGDAIMAVEDVRGDSQKMLAEIQKRNDFEVTVVRASEFRVSIAKGSGIGLVMKRGDYSIRRIEKGEVETWNKSCAPECTVRAGDRIAEVNGVSTSPTAMH